MKHYLLTFLRVLTYPLLTGRELLAKILFWEQVLETYLLEEECQSFKDCLLLCRLKKFQPKGADRYIEYPWVVENLKKEKGRILDVGSTAIEMFSNLLTKDIQIYGLDLHAQEKKRGNVILRKGDIRKTDFPDNYFDAVSCISTLEHIGVAGRYGSDNDPQGDLKAMEEIKRILKPGGRLLLSVPYGARDVLPINKLYNQKRLKKLLAGFKIRDIEYRKFSQKWGYWFWVTEEEAAVTDMLADRWYALCLLKAVKK